MLYSRTPFAATRPPCPSNSSAQTVFLVQPFLLPHPAAPYTSTEPTDSRLFFAPSDVCSYDRRKKTINGFERTPLTAARLAQSFEIRRPRTEKEIERELKVRERKKKKRRRETSILYNGRRDRVADFFPPPQSFPLLFYPLLLDIFGASSQLKKMIKVGRSLSQLVDSKRTRESSGSGSRRGGSVVNPQKSFFSFEKQGIRKSLKGDRTDSYQGPKFSRISITPKSAVTIEPPKKVGSFFFFLSFSHSLFPPFFFLARR